MHNKFRLSLLFCLAILVAGSSFAQISIRELAGVKDLQPKAQNLFLTSKGWVTSPITDDKTSENSNLKPLDFYIYSENGVFTDQSPLLVFFQDNKTNEYILEYSINRPEDIQKALEELNLYQALKEDKENQIIYYQLGNNVLEYTHTPAKNTEEGLRTFSIKIYSLTSFQNKQ